MVEKIPVLENEEMVHGINDKTGTGDKEAVSIHKSERGDDPSLESVETINEDKEEPISNLDIEPNPEEPPSPGQRPAAVRKLDSHLNDEGYWRDSMVGLVMHEHFIASVIRNYGDVEAVSSTPQYGF